MKKRGLKKAQGISLIEVLVAVLIVAVCSVPVIYMVTSSRTDTSRAINYLRAVELANEVIEWAQSVKFENLDPVRFSAFMKSLIDDSSGLVMPLPVGATTPENTNWTSASFADSNLKYSEQYSNAFFYREVEFEDINGSTYFNDGMMKKMTVRVKWNEGVVPTSIGSSDRDRQVELSVLLLNDANMNY